MISMKKQIKNILADYENSVVDPRTALAAISGTLVAERPKKDKKVKRVDPGVAFASMVSDPDIACVVFAHITEHGNVCVHGGSLEPVSMRVLKAMQDSIAERIADTAPELTDTKLAH